MPLPIVALTDAGNDAGAMVDGRLRARSGELHPRCAFGRLDHRNPERGLVSQPESETIISKIVTTKPTAPARSSNAIGEPAEAVTVSRSFAVLIAANASRFTAGAAGFCCGADVGRHGAMKPAGRACGRNGMGEGSRGSGERRSMHRQLSPAPDKRPHRLCSAMCARSGHTRAAHSIVFTPAGRIT
jgi:hypothetical protein